MIRGLLEDHKNTPLVKAIASPSCIQGSIIVIFIWAHIITRYSAKEKEIRRKNRTQNQKGEK